VSEFREEGFISDLFFNSNKNGPILVLNNTNRDEAQCALQPCRWSKRDFWVIRS
jgi:hypothetical protein